MSFELHSVETMLAAEPSAEGITLTAAETQSNELQLEVETSGSEQAIVVGAMVLFAAPIIIAGFKKDQRSYERKRK